MLHQPQPWSAYIELVAQTERIFKHMAAQYPAEVRCRRGCDDCCHAPFRLQLIEAVALKTALASLERGLRRQVLRRAEKGLKAAEALFKNLPPEPEEASAVLAQARLRCALLTPQGCAAYLARPITCRLYGLPTSSWGLSHTCPRSGFEAGRSYATINLDLIFDRLAEMSLDLIKRAGLSHILLAPASVAEALVREYPPSLGPAAGE